MLMEPELEFTIDAVRRAGELIMSYFRQSIKVGEKSKDHPVTQADVAADTLLRETFAQQFPGDGWLSEETPPHLRRLSDSRVWIVDPLDGTKEFIQGIEEFALSVALVADGRPCLAVVYNPATNDLFSAEAGKGAFRNGVPISVSSQNRVQNARIVVSRNEPELFRRLCRVGEAKLVGSIAYKMALVSAGMADLVISLNPKSEWDLCAGELLVYEAGGIVTDSLGRMLEFNQVDPRIEGVIAAGPELHQRAFEWIQQNP